MNERNLIGEIVHRRSASHDYLIESLGVRALTGDEREALRGVVLDELLDNGLDPDDEPTAWGQKLEDLIDWLGHQ